jgi:2-methylisocitrate lyase-like PEP mutase family enzyme
MSFAPAVERFRALHTSGCFVLPNPWDVGSAVYLAHAGFPALATTSAGMAFSRGLPDRVDAVSLAAMLAHVRELAAATPLPVSADFQNAYAHDPAGVAANVTACVATGAAGISVEDATGDSADPLYERDLAIERIRAARAAIDATGSGVVLTARCEAFLVGHADAARIAIDRLVAFADAGADCLYAPRVTDLDMVATIVKAVAPRWVNVLVTAPTPGFTRAKLAALGVSRISVGSALARVAWGAFMRAAAEIAATGTFEALAGGAPFAELDAVFSPAARPV